jgi:predicted acylesterase/phospholipase RssA
MVQPSTRTTVAIACQGGGSQTAFTAGALRRILRDPELDRGYELVALSGTSGGALCCLLAWYGLLAHADDQQHRGTRAADLLTRFWDENAAHDWWDLLVANPVIVGLHRLVDAGWLPAAAPLPWVPGAVKARLQALLERLVRFEDLPGLLRDHPKHPTLLCGAVDVLSGEFAVFEEACPDPAWRREHLAAYPPAVAVDTVLASAAVPPRILPISGFKLIKVARIQMSRQLADRLDLASKVDRSPGYLHELMADGERQAGAFLRDRRDPGAPWWEPMFPHRYRERQEKADTAGAAKAFSSPGRCR